MACAATRAALSLLRRTWGEQPAARIGSAGVHAAPAAAAARGGATSLMQLTAPPITPGKNSWRGRQHSGEDVGVGSMAVDVSDSPLTPYPKQRELSL